MKEEEIIEIVKDYIQYKETNGHIQAKTIGLIDEAIQGLLDLYEKEKEKNIYLTQELETRKWVKVKENGEVEPAFYISKDKIRSLILKYRCFGWHDKDDEYWANRILDGFEQCLKEE